MTPTDATLRRLAHHLGDGDLLPLMREFNWEGPLAEANITRPVGSAFESDRRARLERFALAALQGICASGPGGDFDEELLAAEAWALAEAMVRCAP